MHKVPQDTCIQSTDSQECKYAGIVSAVLPLRATVVTTRGSAKRPTHTERQNPSPREHVEKLPTLQVV